jgi:hypothetical protein
VVSAWGGGGESGSESRETPRESQGGPRNEEGLGRVARGAIRKDRRRGERWWRRGLVKRRSNGGGGSGPCEPLDSSEHRSHCGKYCYSTDGSIERRSRIHIRRKKIRSSFEKPTRPCL